ncbi:GNAT family protein [Clostridium sp. L74]|uniref:GNAT family N-acetyltransferase n=1 Tax=Clostridium sp. L74 TaxID=1560217 RepID=UPI0006AB9101|nr:GNAT family protein [Clostridium sp. L74]KOR24746.1 ribosomal protein N-acetylase [Clostridium sp. L74]
MIVQENICIRTIEEKDLREIYKWNSQKVRGEYQEFQFESFRQLQKEYEKDGFCSSKFQMLVATEKEKLIGLVYINFLREGIVRIGLNLNYENSNKRNGTIILKSMVEFLFENYTIVRIEADTDVENIAAHKILEKVGFNKEGTLRKYRYHHGCFHDSHIYSIIK